MIPYLYYVYLSFFHNPPNHLIASYSNPRFIYLSIQQLLYNCCIIVLLLFILLLLLLTSELAILPPSLEA
jgi:hypothetical protein